MRERTDTNEKGWKVGLAPMEGVTEFPTRLWFWLVSQPQWMTTPFLRVTHGFPFKRVGVGVFPENFSLEKKVGYTLVPQLMGSSWEDVARIAEPLLERVPFIELNCGCPAPTVVGHGSGSGLLKSPELFSSFVSPLVDRFPHRIAVKMRLGFKEEAEFEDLFAQIKSKPLARLTIHGRTREDRYLGHARWAPMKLASEQAVYPVVGSGDIEDYSTYLERKDQAPNLDGVIVGRGALRNPWIFQEISSGKKHAINFVTLKYVLLCYVFLQEIFHRNAEQLIKLVEENEKWRHGLNSLEDWKTCYEVLQKNFSEESNSIISRISLGRLKMLWGYMRPTFPNAFSGPDILRSPNLDEFFSFYDRYSEENQNETHHG